MSAPGTRGPAMTSVSLAFMILGSVAATFVTGLVLTNVRSRRRPPHEYISSTEIYLKDRAENGSDEESDSGAEDIPRTVSGTPKEMPGQSSMGVKLPSQSSFFHPEGPNIGPGSADNWFHKEGDLPLKTDLLHKGHSKGGKLVIVMVGLPGRGKTYIARKVARYLRWINYRTRAFSLARYRIERCGARQPAVFFDNANSNNVGLRLELLSTAVEDLLQYLNRGGECAILDGTNFTQERRELIKKRVAQEDGYEVMWIETLSEDETIMAQHMQQLQDSSPDFLNKEDFNSRVEHYKADYETVQAHEGSYVKIYDAGQRIEIHAAQGFVPTKITSFLMNLHINVRPIYISRHGESLFNVQNLIGGDSELSEMGKEYAQELASFVANSPDLPVENLSVWSSTMKRARQTCKPIKCSRYVEWRALREIEVGVCDAMTYKQVQENFPVEYAAREKDKLNYRYPRGESYLDIINRLEPVIFEMERQKAPLLIVAHQAVLRCLYAYFLDLPNEEVPYLSIPLHTVIKLTPQAFGCSEKRLKLKDARPDGQKSM